MRECDTIKTLVINLESRFSLCLLSTLHVMSYLYSYICELSVSLEIVVTGSCFAPNRSSLWLCPCFLTVSRPTKRASQGRTLERLQRPNISPLRFVHNLRRKDKVSAFQDAANVLLMKEECSAQTFGLD